MTMQHKQSPPAQLLTFSLGGEEYGVDILRVHEIRSPSPLVHIPQSPPFVLGMLDIRGVIVPVIDMRIRFSLVPAENTKTTVTIVLSVEFGNNRNAIGIVVDAVSDVMDVNTANLQPPPDFGTAINTEFISGLASDESKMVMVLDTDRLLTFQELEIISNSTAEADLSNKRESHHATL